MLKALAWKEWRDQRPVVLAAFLLTLLLPPLTALGKAMLSGRVDPGAVAYDCTMLYSALIWPLTALLAGAGAISGEAQDGTLPFLFTRPVRRTTIWAMKVATGLAVLLMVAVVSGLFARLMMVLTGGGPGAFVIHSSLDHALVYLALFMLFSSAVFFSTFIPKPLLSAAAALALSFSVLVLLVTLQYRLKMLLGQATGWLYVEVVLLGVLLLTVSLILFARGEMARGAGRRLGQILMGLALILAVALVTLPLLRAIPRLVPGEAHIVAAIPSPDGRQLLMAVHGGISQAGRIWTVAGPEHRFARLTGLMSGFPVFTPNGEWAVYLGVESLRGQMSLRRMRPDGTDDTLLTMLSQFAPFSVWDLRVSPDGRLVAAAGPAKLAIIKMEQPEETAWYGRDLNPQEYMRLIGWTPDNRELLLLVKEMGSHIATAPEELRALDVTTGARRTITELPANAEPPSGWHPSGGVRRVPLMTTTATGRRERRRFHFLMVDVAGGSQEVITGDSCGWSNVSMTVDQRRLAYAIWGQKSRGTRTCEVHLRDLESGEDRVLASMDNGLGRVLLSADGMKVLAASCGDVPVPWAPRVCTTSVLTPGGEDFVFPAGWVPLAWAGDGHVYLGDDLNAPRRVALGSVANGNLEVILP